MTRAYRSGTIYQRSRDQRWIASLPDGHGGRARYVTATTREEVERKLAKLSTSMTSPRKRSAEAVGPYLLRWVEAERDKGRLRPRTADGYETLVRLHIAPSVGRVKLPDLTADDVDRMVRATLASRSPQTARHAHKVLRRALRHAERMGLVDRNVAALVEAPSVARPTLTPLTADEARRFLAATADDPRHALYAMAIATGMRRGELLALKWSDLDLDAGTVKVSASLRQLDAYRWARDPVKTEKSRRTLSIPAVALAAIKAMPRGTTGYVFARVDGRPLPPSEVTRDFQRTLTAHGFRKVRFHDLRHTAAQIMLDALGGDIRAVSAVLGHSTITTTVDTYGGAADEARRRGNG